MNILVLHNNSLLNWAVSFGLQKEKHLVFNCLNENEATVLLESQQIDFTISELITGKTKLNFLPYIKKNQFYSLLQLLLFPSYYVTPK